MGKARRWQYKSDHALLICKGSLSVCIVFVSNDRTLILIMFMGTQYTVVSTLYRLQSTVLTAVSMLNREPIGRV